MIAYFLIALAIGACLLCVAWCDFRKGNRRDSAFLTFFGLFTIFGGLGLTASSS